MKKYKLSILLASAVLGGVGATYLSAEANEVSAAEVKTEVVTSATTTDKNEGTTVGATASAAQVTAPKEAKNIGEVQGESHESPLVGKEVVINISMLLVFIFIQNVYIKFVLFMVYIIFFKIMSIQVNIFMHKYLVKSDENRTTTVSIFYTFESIIVAILLSVNGALTDKVGIENTWLAFMAFVGVIILSFMFVKLKKRRIK